MVRARGLRIESRYGQVIFIAEKKLKRLPVENGRNIIHSKNKPKSVKENQSYILSVLILEILYK